MEPIKKKARPGDRSQFRSQFRSQLVKRYTAECSECGRTILLSAIWIIAWFRCPICGSWGIGTVSRKCSDAPDDKEG